MRSAGSTGVGKWGSFCKGVLELKKINNIIYIHHLVTGQMYIVLYTRTY